MMRSATPARPLSRSDRAKIFGWLRRVKERVRAGHRDKHDCYLVRGDDDLAEAIVDYSSIAVFGWTWPGEERLAKNLNESDRNVRKRIARLRQAGLLIVIPPSEGWPSNRYLPWLDNRLLFEAALGSERVRAAIWAQCGEGEPSMAPPVSVPETGTAVPPWEEAAFRRVRNERSAESLRDNPQKKISPIPDPAPAVGEEGEDAARTRARDLAPSWEALELAAAYRKAAGVDPDNPQWIGLPYTAQVWVTRGYPHSAVLAFGSRLPRGTAPSQ